MENQKYLNKVIEVCDGSYECIESLINQAKSNEATLTAEIDIESGKAKLSTKDRIIKIAFALFLILFGISFLK